MSADTSGYPQWGSGCTANQDARVYVGAVSGKEKVEFPLAQGRGVWVHVADGQVIVNDQVLSAGDAISIEDEARFELG